MIVADRYRVDAVIGTGAMGVVYRAMDTRLHERPCALKVLQPIDDKAQARFDREVRVISMLSNPHVVKVSDTGRLDDGRPYIVMELLEGESLSEALGAHQPLEPARAVRIIDGVLAALAEAHGKGVVHRDVKPGNVFLVQTNDGREQACLLDFGVAKPFDGSAQPLTAANVAIGTPRYMAPEQFYGEPPDARSDLYSVGIVLYRMLSGSVPFSARDDAPPELDGLPDDHRLAWLHSHRTPARIEGIGGGLWAVTARLLEKRPNERFANAAHAMVRLRETAAGSGLPPLDPSLVHASGAVTIPFRVGDEPFLDDTEISSPPQASPAPPTQTRTLRLGSGGRRALQWALALSAVCLVGLIIAIVVGR